MSYLRGTKQKRSLDFSTIAHFGVYSIFPTKVPYFLSYISYILSKAQTFCIPLMFAISNLESPQFLGNHIIQFFIYFFLPGQRIDFTTSSYQPIALFVAFQIYTWTSIVIAVYLVLQARAKEQNRKILHRIWCYFSYAHIWFLGFMICGFHLHIVKEYAAGNSLILASSGAPRFVVAALAGVAIAWSFVLSLLLCFLFSHSLKTRDLLSLKTKQIIGVEFLENSILYFIFLFVDEGKGKNWAFTLISLLGSGFRLKMSFDYLPIYKLPILKFELIAVTVNACLSLFCFVTVLIGKAGEKFVLFSFLLMAPLLLRISRNYLDFLLRRILLNSKGLNPYHIIHMSYLYKAYLDKRVPLRKEYHRLNFEELFFLGDNQNYKIVDGNKTETFSFDHPHHFKSFARSLLKYFIHKNKALNLLKISYVSQIYKYFQAYLEMISLIQEIKKKKITIGEEIDLLMVFTQIDSKLHKIALDKVHESQLDMYKYIKVNEVYKRFKLQITRQADLQIRFWDYYMQGTHDFLTLTEISKKIEIQKLAIQKTWKKIEKFREKNFTTAYLAYSLYLDILNNRPTQSSAFINHNSYILNKIQLEVDELTNETLYEKETSRIVVSAGKDDIGTITSCSRSIEDIVGYITQEIIGTNIKGIMPTFYRDRHDMYLGNYYEYGISNIMDSTRRIFALDSKGYLTPILLHVKLDPYINHSASFIGLMRPIRENSEFILVKSSGQIDSMTFGIAENLNYDVQFIDFPMFKIWQEFRHLLTVFNKYSLKKIEKRKKDYYKVAIDEETYNLMIQDELHNFSRRQDSFLTGMSTLNPSDQQVTRPEKSLMNIKTVAEMNQLNSIGSMTSSHYLWRKLNKLNNVRNDEMKKVIKEYSEEGAEVNFRNIETGSNIKCFIQISTDIHEESWIIVIRIRDIETEINDESRDSTELEQELRKERIEREKKRSTVLQNQNEIANHMLVGERKRSEDSLGLATNNLPPKSMSKASLNDLPDRPKTKTYLDVETKPDMNTSCNLLPSDRDLTDNRDNIDKYNFNAQGSTREKGEKQKKKLRTSAPRKFKKMVSKAKRIFHFFGKGEVGDRGSSYNKDQGLANKVLNKFVAIKEENKHRDNMDSSSVGSVSSISKLNSTVEHVLQHPYREGIHLTFFWLYFLVIILINLLVILQAIFVREYNLEMLEQNKAIQYTYLRMDALGTLHWALYHLYGVSSGMIDPSANVSTPDFKEEFKGTLDYLTDSSKLLYDSMQNQKSSIQELYFDTMANVYQVEPSTGELASGFYQLNTFKFADLIIAQGLKIEEFSEDEPTLMVYMKNVLVNSQSDFHLVSWDLIDQMEYKINEIFQSSGETTTLFSIVPFTILGIFFLGTAFMLFRINKSYFNFANLFLKLPKSDCENIEVHITRFIQALHEDFQNVDNLDDPITSNRFLLKKAAINIKPKTNSHEIKISKIYKANLFLIIRLWPILIVLSIIVYLETMNSISTTSNINLIHTQVIKAASFMYMSDMAINGLVDLIMTNATGIFAGGPVVNKIREFNKVQSEVQKFTDTYKENDGTYGELEYQYLFGIPCNNSIFEEARSSAEFCNSLTPNGKIGLLDINLLLYKGINEFVDDFLDSERTSNDIQEFFYRQWENLEYIGFIQYTFTNMLLELGKSKFQERVSQDNAQLLSLAISVSVINVLLSLLAIPMVLYQLLNLDFSLKKMFMLVPTHVIVKNRWLKFYLMKTAGKMSKNVERAL